MVTEQPKKKIFKQNEKKPWKNNNNNNKFTPNKREPVRFVSTDFVSESNTQENLPSLLNPETDITNEMIST